MKKKILLLSVVAVLASISVSFAETKIASVQIPQATVQKAVDASNECVSKGKDFYSKFDNAKAEEQYKEAIKLNPENAEAYYEMGNLKASKNYLDEAIEYYSTAIKFSPNNYLYYRVKGLNECLNYKFKEGWNDINKAIELNSKDGAAYIARGNIKYYFGDFKNALTDFNTGMEYLTALEEVNYPTRAQIKVNLMDYDGAIADYEKSLEIAKKQKDTKSIEYYKQEIVMLKDAKTIFKK